ncbi:MAG: hypothetical protein DLM57_11620 [Pseudonocardiales bacterium]|nr:MAG: hypothetical protein DLM57_11620 [Pseudonocardiales bacterium]
MHALYIALNALYVCGGHFYRARGSSGGQVLAHASLITAASARSAAAIENVRRSSAEIEIGRPGFMVRAAPSSEPSLVLSICPSSVR